MPDDVKRSLPVIGWREWVSLPDLGVDRIKAKIDTGARSSSLHAFNMKIFREGEVEYVRFNIHPLQRRDQPEITATVPILERRLVRSSNGEAARRIVIRTEFELLGERLPLDLTLANRDAMGFRMLLGREALRGRFLVDSSLSYRGGRPKHHRGARRRRHRPRHTHHGRTPPPDPDAPTTY